MKAIEGLRVRFIRGIYINGPNLYTGAEAWIMENCEEPPMPTGQQFGVGQWLVMTDDGVLHYAYPEMMEEVR